MALRSSQSGLVRLERTRRNPHEYQGLSVIQPASCCIATKAGFCDHKQALAQVARSLALRISVNIMSSLRILIVDDHEAVRSCLRLLLSSEWMICGEARDGLEAVQKARSVRPDLVIMDISMPRMDGLAATRIIRREFPDTAVIIISQNEPKLVARQAVEVDARGWLPKSELGHALLPAIQLFATGKHPAVSDDDVSEVRQGSEVG
jgi:CheY-like chemotaxis protein